MVFFAWNAQWWYWLMTPFLPHLALTISVLPVCLTNPLYWCVNLTYLNFSKLSTAQSWTVTSVHAGIFKAFYTGRVPFLVTVHANKQYLTSLLTCLTVLSACVFLCQSLVLPPVSLPYIPLDNPWWGNTDRNAQKMALSQMINWFTIHKAARPIF